MKSSTKRILSKLGIAFLVTLFMGIIAFQISPWPATLVIRYAFNSTAIKTNKALEPLVPASIKSTLNLQYDPNDDDAFLDVYTPAYEDTSDAEVFPTIVWIHGGGLISGSKEQVANYCKVLASNGYAVVAIDYTIAPEGRFPKPLFQTNKALSYLDKHAPRLQIDTSNMILAGDSGGAFIATQVANTIYNSDYAELTQVSPGIAPEQLKGLLLYCGIYDISNLSNKGAFGYFMQTVTWSYFGKKDISEDAYAKTASVMQYINKTFPPSFISAGNDDPLLPQSRQLATKLSREPIAIDTLFFPDHREPALAHEYQFNLNTEAGQLALERSLLFLEKITKSDLTRDSVTISD